MTDTAMIEQHYLVEGMTCSHCVASVTEEVSEIAGVERVSVELRVGGASDVTVLSSAPVPLEGIRAAITVSRPVTRHAT
jgi:copper chaperone